MMLLRWEQNKIEPEAGEIGTYTYDSQADVYTTFLRTGAITIAGVKHRSMLADYTGSSPLTIDEIALKYDMPRSWFEQYKRIHDWRHSSVPLTNEQLLDTDNIQDLTEEIVASRRHTAAQKLASAEYKSLEKDALAFRLFEETMLSHFKSLETVPTVTPKLKLPKASNPYALVVCPTDFHWGKHGWEDETGETYNFDEARERLFAKTQRLIEKIPSTPEKIYVGAGSDWFHVDNDQGTTTRGTPQDMCGSPAEIFMSGCRLAREHIELLRQVGPIEIVMMPGNHDRYSSLALMMYLSAVYENVKDVTIKVTANNRVYYTYGSTLLGFTHGDGLKRGNSLAMLMANEAKKEWGQTDHHVWFHGHLHHQRMSEKDGAIVFQMPSLAGHDRYHARSGYTTSKAGLAAYMIDKVEGYIGSLFAPVTEE